MDYRLTPREFAAKFSLEELWEMMGWVPIDFRDGSIWGGDSPACVADCPIDFEICCDLIDEWYEDVPKEDRPDPEELQYAFLVQAAWYIKDK